MRISFDRYMELLNSSINDDRIDEWLNEVEVYDEPEDEIDETEIIEG